MADTKVTYVGDGSTVLYSFPFPYLKTGDIEVTLDGVGTSAFTFATTNTIQFSVAPAIGVEIVIRRATNSAVLDSEFLPGSSLPADDLNRNFRQALYVAEEARREAIDAQAGVIIPGSIGTTELSDEGVTSGKLADGSVTSGKLAPDISLPAGASVVTQNPGDSDTSPASTAFVQNAIDTKLIQSGPLAGFRNLLINANFDINQRSYVSGSNVSAANTYTVDRWRVVVSGQNISWTTSAGVRTVTAPAGGVEQVIEGGSIVPGGQFTLSWTGTATATVNGSAVSNGGQVNLTGGANCTVRFSGGTVSRPQLEPGPVATPFERRPAGIELALCQRYFCALGSVGNVNTIGPAAADSGTSFRCPVNFPVTMRAKPTMTQPQGNSSYSCLVATTTFTANAALGQADTTFDGCLLTLAHSGGGTTGNAGTFRTSSGAFIYFSAEL